MDPLPIDGEIDPLKLVTCLALKGPLLNGIGPLKLIGHNNGYQT